LSKKITKEAHPVQAYFLEKIKLPVLPLRVTGAGITGDETIFELCIILDATGSMQGWINRARDTINFIIHKLI